MQNYKVLPIMAKINTQTFHMETSTLIFNTKKGTLSCLTVNEKKLWIKKLLSVYCISNIIEDKNKYYAACESGEIEGQFLALSKENGITEWFIPGRSFLHIIFERSLYLIFTDETNQHYFLKVNRSNGNTSWHHPVDEDLQEYNFNKQRVRLSYASGKTEMLSIRNGKPIDS